MYRLFKINYYIQLKISILFSTPNNLKKIDVITRLKFIRENVGPIFLNKYFL